MQRLRLVRLTRPRQYAFVRRAQHDGPAQAPPPRQPRSTARWSRCRTAPRRFGSAVQTNDSVRYQFDIANTARQCHVEGAQFGIKVGVAGHLLIGPAGAPGAYSAQLRIVVRRDSDQKPAILADFTRSPPTRRAPTRRRSVRFRTDHAALHAPAGRPGLYDPGRLRQRPCARQAPAKPLAPQETIRIDKARALRACLNASDQDPQRKRPAERFALPAPKAQPPRKRSGQRTAEGMTLWKAAGAPGAPAHRRG